MSIGYTSNSFGEPIFFVAAHIVLRPTEPMPGRRHAVSNRYLFSFAFHSCPRPQGRQRLSLALLLIPTTIAAAGPIPQPEVVWQLGGHTFRIHDAAFSADGSLAATGSEDGTAKIWSTADGRLLRTFTASTGDFQPAFAIYGVTFSPDGQELWGATVESSYAWRISDGTALRSLGHMEAVYQTVFSPDGTMIAIAGSPAGSEDTTEVYRRSDGQLLHSFEPAASLATVFSADSQYLIAATTFNVESPAGRIRWFRLSDGGLVRTVTAHASAIQWLALSPDGAILASCGNDATVKLWNADNGAPLRTLTGHTGTVNRVQFSPDGIRVASCGVDGKIRIWNTADGAPLDVLTPTGQSLGTLNWSPDGATFLTTSGVTFFEPQRGAFLADAATGTTNHVLTKLTGAISDLALSPDGSRLATYTFFNGIEVRDVNDGSLVWSSPPTVSEARLAFTADSSRLAVAGSNGVVRFFDAATGGFQQSLTAHAGGVGDIAFSPDGQTMITRCFSEQGKIWNYPALTLRSPLPATSGLNGAFLFTPDNLAIASTGAAALAFSRSSDGGFFQSFVGHGGATRDVAISADGTRIVSGSADTTARIWDASNGSTLHVLTGFSTSVNSVALSPDGTAVATGTRDLRIWRAATGELSAACTVDIGTGAGSVRFTPDGRNFVYSRPDSAIVVARNPLAIAPGDVDGNGSIDGTDALKLIDALLGLPLTPHQLARADINSDSRHDGTDIAAFLDLLLE